MSMDEDEYLDDFELDGIQRLARQDVPWKRRGVPGHKIQKYDSAWESYYVNTVKKYRLYTDAEMLAFPDHGNVVWERAYAQYWDYYANGNGLRAMDMFRCTPEIDKLIKDEDDQVLFETTLQVMAQWLGTIAGTAFFNRAREFAQLETERLDRLRNPKYDEHKKIEEIFKKKSTKEEIRTEVKRKSKKLIDKITKTAERKAAKRLYKKIVQQIRDDIYSQYVRDVVKGVREIYKRRKRLNVKSGSFGPQPGMRRLSPEIGKIK